jgi:hypothetical protein
VAEKPAAHKEVAEKPAAHKKGDEKATRRSPRETKKKAVTVKPEPEDLRAKSDEHMALDPDGGAAMLVDTLVAYGQALRDRITELERDTEALEAQLADVEAENSRLKADKDPISEARARMDRLFDAYAAALNSGDPCEVQPAMDAIITFARGDAKEFDFGGEHVRTVPPPCIPIL